MNVKEIIVKHLKEIGADGLCNPENQCGCEIDNDFPCDMMDKDCVPAKKKIATKEDIDDESDYEIGDEIFVPSISLDNAGR